MMFKDTLNKYIELTQCSSKKLAQISGLSETTISRYRSGQRSPSSGSDSIIRLAAAFEELGKGKLDREDILAELRDTPDHREVDHVSFTHNLNTIINLLDINSNDLAKAINYDPSYLSRIKSMQRKPSNPVEFAEKVAVYITRHYTSEEDLNTLRKLTGSKENLDRAIVNWITDERTESNNYVGGFLDELDKFNLTEYPDLSGSTENISFDSGSPLPDSKSFYGKSEIQKAELRFMDDLIHNENTEYVWLQNSIPLTEIMNETEYTEKWFRKVSLLLSKGIQLNIIHDVNRPVIEMLYAIERWIPLYLLGHINSYYLKESNKIFSNTDYVSNHSALSGECIGKKMNHGFYYFTRNKKEVSYYQTRIKDIFENSEKLFTFYRNDKPKPFFDFINDQSDVSHDRYTINSSLPLHTLSPSLLKKIADRLNLSEDEFQKLKNTISILKNRAETILQSNTITESIPSVTREEFEKSPINIYTTGTFIEKNLSYTYEEYLQHLELTLEFSKNRPNFIVKKHSFKPFDNLTITIIEGKCAILSKFNTPTISIVVHQPQLLKAFENYTKFFYDKNTSIV